MKVTSQQPELEPAIVTSLYKLQQLLHRQWLKRLQYRAHDQDLPVHLNQSSVCKCLEQAGLDFQKDFSLRTPLSIFLFHYQRECYESEYRTQRHLQLGSKYLESRLYHKWKKCLIFELKNEATLSLHSVLLVLKMKE